MKIIRHNDIEQILHKASSSYGSLDESNGSTLQRHAHELAGPSSSSSCNGGLSMHAHDQSAQGDASSATAAVDYAMSNGGSAIGAAFGSEEFQTSSRSGEHSNHHHEHHPAHQEHLVKSRQYYRDMVLGVNDGLVSTFLLVAGVVGGGMDQSAVLLTAISGAIAGAISMFAGEYVATKSQNEVMEGEIKLEHDHIKKYHAQEMEELQNLLSLIGIPGSQPYLNIESSNDETITAATAVAAQSTKESLASTSRDARKLRRRLTDYYAGNPNALLKIMIALEFGIIDEEVRSPLVAGGTSMLLFFVGSLPSVIPFTCIDDPTVGLVVSGVACGIGLFVVGAVKTWATRGNMFLAAMENLLITAVGAAIAYGIGVGFNRLVGKDEMDG